MPLSYETPYLFAPKTAQGLTHAQIDAATSRLTAAHKALVTARKHQELPFTELPYDEATVKLIEERAAEFAEYKQVVVIGIGGSDLGARAAFQALTHPAWNEGVRFRGEYPQMFFAGDTTDPDVLHPLLDLLHFEKTLVVMVSKSGKTIEQMSNFLIIREKLIDAVGKDQAKRQIVTITDPAGGVLRELTNSEGWASLPHHAAGGRFSVLSTVGLFPLALVGIDIRALLNGAREIDEADISGELTAVGDYALQHVVAYEHGKKNHILFTYKNSLDEFGRWYKQLWAESLGKKETRGGKEVFIGPTPGVCVGPRDQHSQAQLYAEGPADKLFTFLTISDVANDISIPTELPDNDFLGQLNGLSMAKILQAEFQGTAKALSEAGRPSVHIELTKLDAYHLGALFYFFELATAYAGELFDIDAYNQPGVERGKILMYEHLKG